MVADKMVRTKWYTDKMSLDKMARTKWYGQNGTNRTVPIKSSINLSIPFPLTNDFFINPASTWIPLHFLRVLSTICDFWLLISINFTLIVIYSKTCYHFVRTILSVPFCPYYFLRAISSATILSGHQPISCPSRPPPSFSQDHLILHCNPGHVTLYMLLRVHIFSREVPLREFYTTLLELLLSFITYGSLIKNILTY